MIQLRNSLTLGILAACCFLLSCSPKQQRQHGYVEAELTYLSVPFSGKLVQLNVERGQQVKPGDTLFSLDPMPELMDYNSAQDQLHKAEADLANLEKGLRPSEIAAIEAQIDSVKANISFYQREYKRHIELVKKAALQKETLDRTVQNLEQSQAELKRLEATLTTAKLPARDDVIAAARKQVEATKALVAKAKWALQEKNVTAKIKAQVFDRYFRVGETVPANHPVLSLLAPNDIKVVFFVPEPILSTIKLGQHVMISCDDCAKEIKATIRFISPKAEFTPPVIYSEQSRAKLVYRVECRLYDQEITTLNPGQPVDITLAPGS